MLLSEIEPSLSPLVINGILAVFLGASAIITGCLILWSDAHGRRVRSRLVGMIAVGVLLLSGGMASWNIGGDELRAAADARFESLLAERFDATSTRRYSAVKADLASAGDSRIIVTSGGVALPVIVHRSGGLLQFFSSAGVEYLPDTRP